MSYLIRYWKGAEVPSSPHHLLLPISNLGSRLYTASMTVSRNLLGIQTREKKINKSKAEKNILTSSNFFLNL